MAINSDLQSLTNIVQSLCDSTFLISQLRHPSITATPTCFPCITGNPANDPDFSEVTLTPVVQPPTATVTNDCESVIAAHNMEHSRYTACNIDLRYRLHEHGRNFQNLVFNVASVAPQCATDMLL